MNITTALLHALKANGAQQIFGIPGDFALPYFRIIEESRILPLYTFSHEPGVGFAADAAARYHGGLGVAAVTYGAGALNMVNAVAAAYAEKSPVVVISGAPGAREASSGLFLHHQAKTLDSQYRIYQEITCDQVRPDDPATAPQRIAQVLASAKRHSRPVYIELPRDLVAAPSDPVPPLHPTRYDPEAVAACADEILQRLRSAKQPVLLVGVEVRRYGVERAVAELAKRLGVPVVTSFMGRGLLADAEAPLLGTYMGIAGDPEITRLVEESDGLFLLGVILSDTNFAVSEKRIDLRRTMHAFDGEVRIAHHRYPEIPLDRLVAALLERTPDRGERFQPAKRNYPTGLVADDAAITPQAIATAVNDLIAAHGQIPLAADTGDCLFTAMEIVHTALVAPGYYATMGFGVPAGMGICACGERPIILVGDGAFQMTGWELGNCRRYGWDPIVIVLNNASWEMLRAFQPESRFNDFDDWHFAAMAEGMGGDGVRVRTRRELKAALDRAWRTRGRFQLIEAMIPRGAMSPTLARFVAGVKRLSSSA